MLLLFKILLVIFHDVHSFSIEAFHEYMTEPELAYYFNTGDRNSVPDYEIVYLPVSLPIREAASEYGENVEVDYNFKTFGRPISLKLKPNENLLAPTFKTFLRTGDDTPEILSSPLKNCHFLHKDGSSVASISICQPRTVQGLIFLDNSTFEIHPLNERLRELIKVQEPLLDDSANLSEETAPHIVKRAIFTSDAFHDDAFPIRGNVFRDNKYFHENEEIRQLKMKRSEFKTEMATMDLKIGETANFKRANPLTLELALFFDEAAYKIFSPYMKYDDKKLQDMILAYVNGVQALYHHPSLGTSLDLVLVRLDIMKRQPSGMPHYDGERSKLLDSFCAYQNSLNHLDDANPSHWDMGLYVSGLDFFAYENGRKSGVTMGLATVGGVCLNQYACIIAELGTTNVFGKPYPSAGFTSVYILAHEIGHNLGMHHDSSGNSCSKEGYVMSPSRGTNGETQWSTCSAEIMRNLGWAKCLKDKSKPQKNLDHSRFLDTPGRSYTAKKQCEILLRDKDAVMSTSQKLDTICYNLQCKTPHRSGYYHAGPALDGTECGRGKYCYGGDCTSRTPPKPVQIIPGGWGDWQEGTCMSGCIDNSKGYSGRRRECNKPVPVNTDEGCEGPSYEIALCKDEKVCDIGSRKPSSTFASEKCREFSLLLNELDPKGVGLQAPHEEIRLWMGCTIFCRRRDTGSFYTPRIELNDLGISPYFPDGTWCHNENGKNYYCLQHHCLPENFKISKNTFTNQLGGDIPLPQNAFPHSAIPPGLQAYFSLHPNGKPMQTVLKPGQAKPPKDEDWETNDYIELPDQKTNEIPDESETYFLKSLE